MFEVLVLQALYNLSDDQAEFHIQDRLSFMRFVGLALADRVPYAKTIWLFREDLAEAGAIKNLFLRFNKYLAKAGYLALGGQIVDTTIAAAPKQRNTEEEKAAIKAGEVPEAWKDKPAKLRRKDRDARWTVKFSKPNRRRKESRSMSTSRSRPSATRTTWRSTGDSTSSATGQRRAPSGTGCNCRRFSIGRMPAQRCGRIPLTDRRKTRTG